MRQNNSISGNIAYAKIFMPNRRDTTYNTSNNDSEYSGYSNDTNSKYFLICKSCFWCATYLNRSKIIIKCPACDDDRLLNTLTILDNEVYGTNFREGSKVGPRRPHKRGVQQRLLLLD